MMNYALFSLWVKDIERDLVERFGVPAEEAIEIMQYLEVSSIAAEARNRKQNQLRLNFRKYGSKVMAERLGVSHRAARKKYNRIIAEPKKEPVVPLSVPLQPVKCHQPE